MTKKKIVEWDETWCETAGNTTNKDGESGFCDYKLNYIYYYFLMKFNSNVVDATGQRRRQWRPARCRRLQRLRAQQVIHISFIARFLIITFTRWWRWLYSAFCCQFAISPTYTNYFYTILLRPKRTHVRSHIRPCPTTAPNIGTRRKKK